MKKLEAEIAGLQRNYRDKTGKFLSIGSVESATGGRIADMLTNIAGSSDYFKGALVSYSNEIKMNIANVKEETLKLHGAVSSETAREMAEGGRKLLGVDICVSTTGIAGPGGATTYKPVGLFYIAIASSETITSHKYIFSGRRVDVKQKAANSALKIIREHIEKCLLDAEETPLEIKHVVTCFLEHKNMLLLLRRSQKVGTYKRAWAAVSGYIETNPLDQAYAEIREETGLFKGSIRLVKTGDPIEVIDKNLHRKWVVHPFLFHVTDPEKIKTDWEHTEMKWIKPKELAKYKTVPGLKRALDAVND